MQKYATLKVYQHDEEENQKQIGDTQWINLSHYMGKDKQEISIYFRPNNSEIELVKIDAVVSVRPSASKETSNKLYTSNDEYLATIAPAVQLLSNDPEQGQVWNHGVY